MPPLTDFRNAVTTLVSTATGITTIIKGERTGPASDDVIAVWSTASAANESNQQYRVYAVTARVFVARDDQVSPDEDDPVDQLELLELAVLEATADAPILGGARLASVDTAFDPSAGSVEFAFIGEVLNPAGES